MGLTSTPLSQSKAVIQSSQITRTPKSSQSNSSILIDDICSDEFDIENLRSEQDKTDNILHFLLNFNCQKRKPGRPKASESNINYDKVPPSVKDSLRTVTNINELHGGVLLDYLTKINKFNKTLLDALNQLNNKYSILLNKLESSNNTPNVIVTSPSSPKPSLNNSEATDKIKALSDENKDLQQKIDSLDQRILSSTVLCSGNKVDEIISSTEADNDKINKVFDQITGLAPGVVNSDIQNISIIGKDKKHFKIVCNNINIKNKILSEARHKKLDNIYFSEFLTPLRNKLFYELRQIKRKYPDKVKSIYTRNGNIFYKLVNDDNQKLIRSMENITELTIFLSSSRNEDD